MMTDRCRYALLDTDIILKIGSYHKEKILDRVLRSLDVSLYVHEYIVSQELIYKGLALDQFSTMLEEGVVTVVNDTCLNSDEKLEYTYALSILSKQMSVDLYKKRDHNAGEVYSMALAFAKGYSYFISDDRGARVAAKKHLQYLDNSYVNTIQLKDIIKVIRAKQDTLHLSRKEAKHLYTYSSNPKLGHTRNEIERLKTIHLKQKQEFDQKLWPDDT
jgi:hypothetical protein